MVRRLLKLVLLLAFGATLTIAVAWACALWGPRVGVDVCTGPATSRPHSVHTGEVPWIRADDLTRLVNPLSSLLRAVTSAPRKSAVNRRLEPS